MKMVKKKIAALIILSFSATVVLAAKDLLKDEELDKGMLVGAPIPKITDSCACVQAKKVQVSKNDAEAIEEVANCFISTAINDCSKDQANYLSWLIAAATRSRPRSQFSLGIVYNFGAGVKIDHKVAADWWAQAARLNLPAGYFMLAQSYEEGMGRPQSKSKAIELYKAAQEHGYGPAKEKLQALENKN